MKNANIKRMVTMALLIALVAVLQLLGYVLPRVGPFGLSFVLIPIVIGAAVYGPSAGAILGGAFGIIVCLCSYNGMDAGGFMVWQANPFLCFLVVMTKGVLAGLVSGLLYKVFSRKSSFLGMLLAAIICPIVNTGVFLLGMWLFFFEVLRNWAAGSDVAGYVLTGIVLANFVPELLINIVFSPAGQRVVHAVKKV